MALGPKCYKSGQPEGGYPGLYKLMKITNTAQLATDSGG